MMHSKDIPPASSEYSGIDRRRYNHEEAVLEVKRDLDALKQRVDDIYYMLHKFEGMSLLVKFIFIAALPVWLLVVWIRDHIKW